MVRLYNPESVNRFYFKDGAELTLGTFECARNTLFVLPSRVSNPSAWSDGQVLRGGELIYRSDTGSVLFYDAVGTTWKTLANTAHAATHKNGGSDEILLNELGEPTGSVDFNSQQALNLRIENRTSDPSSPAVGQIWLRTDL